LDLSTDSHSFSLKNKIGRLVWNISAVILFRPFGSRLFKKWHVFVLKCFGAKIEWSSHSYTFVKTGALWNLEIEANSSLGPKVDCYNLGKISVGANTVIS
jgi:putative colanic acid biosynthesis acetyltransferase WcaF